MGRERSTFACRGLVVVAGLLAGLALPSVATALPGPPLKEPEAKLGAALECSADLDSSNQRTVLLVHGLASTPEEDWSWNYAQLLPRWGYPVCTVRFPDRAFDDAQRNVEYVVFAIRRIAQRTGRKVAVIGHSHGTIVGTYALRYWPDLARKVSDFIGFAGLYEQGTSVADLLCPAGVCLPMPPLVWQLRPRSSFYRAMPKAPLPAPGPDQEPAYTAYMTLTDELVLPQPSASTIHAPGARNYIQQDLCPADIAEHLLIVAEAPFAALTRDALSHPGPANLERVGRVPCGLIPEAASIAPALPPFALGIAIGTAQNTSAAEPALRCYLNPACPKRRLAPVLAARTTPGRDRRRPFAFTTTGTIQLPEGATRQCAGTITLRVKRRNRNTARRTAALTRAASLKGPDCEFRVRLKAPRRGRLRIGVRYSGTKELLPAAAPSKQIRAG